MTDADAVVAIPCWHSQATLPACLEALRAQSITGFEVRVVDSTPSDETAAIVAEIIPEASYIRSSSRLHPHAARNVAFGGTEAAFLVSTDPDCVPERDWLERLLGPLAAGEAELAVGAMGLVRSGRHAAGIHICKYAPFLPGLGPGWRLIAPSANLAISRGAWEAIGPFPSAGFVGDAVLSWRAGGRYGLPRFVPEAVVSHHHGDRFSEFLRSRRARGHEFALTRMAGLGWTRRRAAAHLLAAPLLPLPPLVAGVRDALRAGLLRDAIGSLPVHAAGHLAWTLGEAAAYARGAFRVSRK